MPRLRPVRGCDFDDCWEACPTGSTRRWLAVAMVGRQRGRRTTRRTHGALKKSRRGASPRCPQCGEVVGSPEWLPPHRAELRIEGRVYGDLAFGPGDGSFLVSERFRRLWRRSGLTGIAFHDEVEIAWISYLGGLVSGRCPRYFRATTSATAAMDLEASGIEWLNGPPTCSWCRLAPVKGWQRIAVDRSTWTGGDVFALRGLRVWGLRIGSPSGLCALRSATRRRCQPNLRGTPRMEFGIERTLRMVT